MWWHVSTIDRMKNTEIKNYWNKTHPIFYMIYNDKYYKIKKMFPKFLGWICNNNKN